MTDAQNQPTRRWRLPHTLWGLSATMVFPEVTRTATHYGLVWGPWFLGLVIGGEQIACDGPHWFDLSRVPPGWSFSSLAKIGDDYQCVLAPPSLPDVTEALDSGRSLVVAYARSLRMAFLLACIDATNRSGPTVSHEEEINA